MVENDKILSDEVLRTVALELMYDNPQKWQSSEGPTAMEIARRHHFKTDIVKKKLKVLQDAGLVRVMDYRPKIWKFDEFSFNEMDVNDPLCLLITRYDDDDYEKYYF